MKCCNNQTIEKVIDITNALDRENLKVKYKKKKKRKQKVEFKDAKKYLRVKGKRKFLKGNRLEAKRAKWRKIEKTEKRSKIFGKVVND